MPQINSYHWFLPYAVILPSFQSISVLKKFKFSHVVKVHPHNSFHPYNRWPILLVSFKPWTQSHPSNWISIYGQLHMQYMFSMYDTIHLYWTFCPKRLIFIDVCSHFIQLLIIVSLWSISSICCTSIVKNYWRFYFIHVCQLWFIWQPLFISSHPPLFQLLFCPYLLLPFPLPHIFSIVPFIYPFLENFPYQSIAPNHSPLLWLVFFIVALTLYFQFEKLKSSVVLIIRSLQMMHTNWE